MRVIGVDLAWGSRNDTGVCAVEDGRVLDSARLRSDDEIVAWIRERTAGDMLVAFDAPLIVTNPRGRRPCEALISEAYGREEAACHSSNLARPGFADGGRAARLARCLALTTDPDAVGCRPFSAAIEVYPHTALVSLFELPRTLKYKAKHGRTMDDRRREFRMLLGHLTTLADSDPPLDVATSPRWRALVAVVDGAERGADLDRMEDELDAYVCAYIGLYHVTWRGTRSLTIGDGACGYIVTPVTERHAALIRVRAAASGVPVR